jgi:hypothetical protein
MKEFNGDLWAFHEEGYHVVVTTNLGWGELRSPTAVYNNMGAGSVQAAARRWPWLPAWYGRRCCQFAASQLGSMPVLKRDDLRVVFLPVKPLNRRNPAASWDQLASVPLIRSGLEQLRSWFLAERKRGMALQLALTLPGAGNGGLERGMVYGLVRECLDDLDVALVDRQLDVARAAWEHSQRLSPEWGSCVSCGGDRLADELDHESRCHGCARP